MTDFRYSEADWQKIEATLPSRESMFDIRGMVELQGEYFLRDFRRPRPTALKILYAVQQVANSSKKLWEDILVLDQATEGLLSLVPMITKIPSESQDAESPVSAAARNVPDTESFLRILADLGPAADTHADELERLAKSPRLLANSVDWWENKYINDLFRVWGHLGGELRASVNPRSGKAGGPLIRFLSSATSPVLIASERLPLTDAQLRSRVRKSRRANGELS